MRCTLRSPIRKVPAFAMSVMIGSPVVSDAIWRFETDRQSAIIRTGRSELRTMSLDLSDLPAFVAVARAGGFREAAKVSGLAASSLSEAVRRLETKLGVRLLNRTTRSVAP